jgi:hypothetical protein
MLTACYTLQHMPAKEATLTELGECSRTSSTTWLPRTMCAIVQEPISIANLATKADLAPVTGHVASIERDLKSIRHDPNELADVDNILGHRKEIDHALERIAVFTRTLPQ